MSFSIHDAMVWSIVLLGAVVAIYLIWGLLKASCKMLFYLALLILFVALLKGYNLLPPEVSEWLDLQRIMDELHEKFHERDSWKTLIDETEIQEKTPSEEKEEAVPSSDALMREK